MLNQKKLKIAFIGFGLMGRPMCHNLLNAGYDVTGYNRTASKLDSLSAKGLKLAASPKDAIEDVDIVFTMLTTNSVTEDVLFSEGYDCFKEAAIVIDCSSGCPEDGKLLAAKLKDIGVSYLDCPASGGVVGAESGSLALMAGGELSVFEGVRPVLECLGSPHYMGPSGSGQIAKLANQTIVATTIGAVSEAFLLAERNGISLSSLRNVLCLGFAYSRVLELHGQRILAGEFEPGGTIQNQIKDLNNVCKAAESSNLQLPITNAITGLFRDSAEISGIQDLDHSALYLHLKNMQKVTCD